MYLYAIFAPPLRPLVFLCVPDTLNAVFGCHWKFSDYTSETYCALPAAYQHFSAAMIKKYDTSYMKVNALACPEAEAAWVRSNKIVPSMTWYLFYLLNLKKKKKKQT